MTEFRRGDVVLVGFVFSDETGEKQRPAVVVSSDSYQMKRQEAIIAAITSRVERRLLGDHLIVDWQEAGLLFPYGSDRDHQDNKTKYDFQETRDYVSF